MACDPVTVGSWDVVTVPDIEAMYAWVDDLDNKAVMSWLGVWMAAREAVCESVSEAICGSDWLGNGVKTDDCVAVDEVAKVDCEIVRETVTLTLVNHEPLLLGVPLRLGVEIPLSVETCVME